MTLHLILDGLLFLIVFALVQLVVYRIIKASGDAFPGQPHTIAIRGLALAASLKLIWLYGVGWFELTHAQNFPLTVRLVYTYLWSLLSIAALVLWLTTRPAAKAK